MNNAIRRANERAQTRGHAPWRKGDVLAPIVLAPVIWAALFEPHALSHVGELVVGSTAVVPGLELTWSNLLITVERWAVVVAAAYSLFSIRSLPWQQRLILVLISAGSLLNYARNVVSANPATLSFVVALAGLLIYTVSLMVRPTVWEDRENYRLCAERAEAELFRLRGEA